MPAGVSKAFDCVRQLAFLKREDEALEVINEAKGKIVKVESGGSVGRPQQTYQFPDGSSLIFFPSTPIWGFEYRYLTQTVL